MHAACSKLKVTADELCALVILFCADAHVTVGRNLKLLESGNIGRQYDVLLGQNLCTLGTEVVEAEVGGRVHAPVAVVGAAQSEANLGNFTQAGEVNIAPVVDDVGSSLIAQVGEVVVLRAGHLVISVIAGDGELEPVALVELLGKGVTASQGVVGIAAVGDVEAGNDCGSGKQRNLARTVELCSKGYAIVGRAVVAAANDVVPLVVERLELCCSTVSIAKPVPVVPIAHATAGKCIVAAHEEFALVIVFCADTHVTIHRFGDVCNVLEGGNRRSGRHLNSQFHSRNTAEDGSLRDSCEVGSTACRLRCGAMVANGIAKTSNSHYAISEFNSTGGPVLRNGE